MGEAETVPSDEKQAETGICTAEESIVWSQEVEVCLFHAMLGHKPVGKMNSFLIYVNNRPWTPHVNQQLITSYISQYAPFYLLNI